MVLEASLSHQGQDMCRVISPRHFRSLMIVSFLAAILASPVRAQTSSNAPSTGTPAGPTSSSPTPVPPNAGSGTAAPSTETNTKAAKSDSEPTGSPAQSTAVAKEAGPTILISINKTNQRMTVFLDGIEKYDWPVSTGRPGYSTPSGTYTATSMNEIWYSKQWDNSPMPHSVFFIKDGHAIHGTYEAKNLGKPASHGCVRISLENAATLYALVEKSGLKNTQVVLTGATPGGDFKYPNVARAQAQVQAQVQAQAGPGWGFFGPSPGAGAYYGGYQSYYRPSGYSRW
jgi:lipoprotein-anchoring transpeptidase ErfK/SrfK